MDYIEKPRLSMDIRTFNELYTGAALATSYRIKIIVNTLQLVSSQVNVFLNVCYKVPTMNKYLTIPKSYKIKQHMYTRIKKMLRTVTMKI